MENNKNSKKIVWNVLFWAVFSMCMILFTITIILHINDKDILLGNYIFPANYVSYFSLMVFLGMSTFSTAKKKIYTTLIYLFLMILYLLLVISGIQSNMKSDKIKIQLPDNKSILLVETESEIEFYQTDFLTAKRLKGYTNKIGFENDNILKENKYTYHYDSENNTISFSFELGEWNVYGVKLKDYDGFSRIDVVLE